MVSRRLYQMATQTQVSYITDLAVLKTKEFKEVKELLVASDIAPADSEVIALAGTLAEICNALTDLQASKFIDVLIALKPPERSRAYGAGRVRKTVAGLEEIKAIIADWDF